MSARPVCVHRVIVDRHFDGAVSEDDERKLREHPLERGNARVGFRNERGSGRLRIPALHLGIRTRETAGLERPNVAQREDREREDAYVGGTKVGFAPIEVVRRELGVLRAEREDRHTRGGLEDGEGCELGSARELLEGEPRHRLDLVLGSTRRFLLATGDGDSSGDGSGRCRHESPSMSRRDSVA